MGSRGAFVDVDMGNFTFKNKENQVYFSIGSLSNNDNVKILIQEKGSVKRCLKHVPKVRFPRTMPSSNYPNSK